MRVKSSTREEIDAWPLTETGLPIRVINAVRPAQVTTVGQLRLLGDSELIKLRSLGRTSLGHVHSFFKLCGQIEQGRLAFSSLGEVFSLLLDESQQSVLIARYGLDQKGLGVARHPMTLQQIADMRHITRERVRQIQERALAALHSRLALACLQPFYDRVSEALDQLGGVGGVADLDFLQSDPAFGGWSLGGTLHLLSNANPARLSCRYDYFSNLPLDYLQRLEAALLQQLEKSGVPETIEVLQQESDAALMTELKQPRPVIACILDHAPEVAATTDGRYFLYRNGATYFLTDVLSRLERPAHFRKITAAFNEGLKPQKRKGAGFVLKLLAESPRCIRVDRGTYDLKAD